MSFAIACLRSFSAYLFVAVYVLVVGPPAMLAALLLRSPTILYRVGPPAASLALAIAGIRTRASGLEHLQTRCAAVYCCNHTSNIEPPLIFVLLAPLFPRVGVFYKAELQKLPILSRAFTMAGFVPVERGNREQSMAAIENGARALRGGYSFLVFPEGTRSRSGAMLPFKKGGFIMAIKAQAPIVPIAVQGARAAMRKGSPIIRPVTVTVRIGPRIETSGLAVSDRDRVITAVRARIQQMLDRGPLG